MSDENNAKSEQAPGSISEQASEGIKARRAFVTKFLLGGDSQDWINKNVVAKGKGTQVLVGRVVGFCTGFERKQSEWQGKILESIMLHGQYEYESTVTGEVGQASSAYLPGAYSEQLAALFDADPSTKMVEVDIDLALEATGKTIAYEWLVINHGGGKADLVKRLRARRRPGQKALPAPAQAAPAELEAPKNEAADAGAADAPEQPAATGGGDAGGKKGSKKSAA